MGTGTLGTSPASSSEGTFGTSARHAIANVGTARRALVEALANGGPRTARATDALFASCFVASLRTCPETAEAHAEAPACPYAGNGAPLRAPTSSSSASATTAIVTRMPSGRPVGSIGLRTTPAKGAVGTARLGSERATSRARASGRRPYGATYALAASAVRTSCPDVFRTSAGIAGTSIRLLTRAGPATAGGTQAPRIAAFGCTGTCGVAFTCPITNAATG